MNRSALRRAAPSVLAAWVAARIVVGLAFLTARWAAGRVDLPLGPLWRDGFTVWDGNWYVSLAANGYAGTAEEGWRFFPLYPLLGRLLAPIVGSESLALILVANLTALAAGFAVFVVVREVFDEAAARRAVWVAALLPGAFPNVLAYTEPLALLFGALWFLALHRRRWWEVALWGLAAGLVRPVGVLLLVPLAVEVWTIHRRGGRLNRVAVAAAFAAPVSALVGFLVWVQVALGDWMVPIREQGRIRLGLREPVSRLLWGVVNGITRRPVDLYNVGIGMLLLALLAISWKRLPRAWWWSAAITVWVALAGGYIDSIGRYAAASVPVVAAVALWPATAGRWRIPLLVASAVGMWWLATNAFLGYVVP